MQAFPPSNKVDGCVAAGIEIKAEKDPTLTGYRACSVDTEGWIFTSHSNRAIIITYTRDRAPSLALLQYRYGMFSLSPLISFLN
ncbi:unnamed protein product [Strongylus vulgaris]|uniref:Uncharacterized protein n=1 Tax=Strongylus vulgaris TaxID=40348 RepID=A0A3P7LNJ6_STRVU|nr:unnamed protein product [Strongylus vulgaris]